jgi:hypothetical protein
MAHSYSGRTAAVSYLKPETLAQLEATVKARNISKARYIEMALEAFLLAERQG